MNILFIGDIVGRPGRKCLAECLPRLREQFAIDVVIANAENAAGGLGAIPRVIDELLKIGVAGMTMGNHTWRKREFVNTIDKYRCVVRPANYPARVPGQGSAIIELPDGRAVGLVNVLGRVFMEAFDCPFTRAEEEVERLRRSVSVVLVDFHAEATSEKVALGWHLDGKCTAVVGTHTHIQTADERVLPKGTAYITDVGMTGPRDSVIGVEPARAIHKFLTGMPSEFRVAKGPAILGAVLIEADDETGSAKSIRRVSATIQNTLDVGDDD